MSRFAHLPVWCVCLMLSSSVTADVPPAPKWGDATVAVYLDNYETTTQPNPVIVVSDGTSLGVVRAIRDTLTKLKYPNAKLSVSDDAGSDYHLDIRIGIAIYDGRAELFIGRDFPLSFATVLADSLADAGVKDVRLRCTKNFALWADDYAPSGVSNRSDPFAGSPTKNIPQQHDPFNP